MDSFLLGATDHVSLSYKTIGKIIAIFVDIIVEGMSPQIIIQMFTHERVAARFCFQHTVRVSILILDSSNPDGFYVLRLPTQNMTCL
jgi:hypothetical protein